MTTSRANPNRREQKVAKPTTLADLAMLRWECACVEKCGVDIIK
jgi:hypothetical protein